MTSPIETNNVVERAKALALAGDFSPDDLGGDIGTMSLRNPDGPELLSIVQSLSDRIDVQLEALAKRDAAAAKCPIRRGYQDTCECCGATSSGACGMISAADYAFVEAVRASLEAGNAKP